MIPKVINYCWFGKKELPIEEKKCIESWKKFCPDYKIVEWNEENYDIKKNKYIKEAYEKEMWAFVSDYARIDIIYNNGGIYFDTDVEVIKPIDDLLHNKMFCGWEENLKNENFVAFGLGFGAEKENPVLKEILEEYEKISFIKEDGTLNLVACPYYQTKALKKFGLDDTKRSLQKLENGIVVYPEDYFSPKSHITGEINITENTYSIHQFSMSWINKKDAFYKRLEWKICKVTNYKFAHCLVKFLSLPYRIKRKLKKILKKNNKNI